MRTTLTPRSRIASTPSIASARTASQARKPVAMLVLLSALCLGLTACGQRSVNWEERTEADISNDVGKRTVLFAPVAAKSIAAVYGDARTQFSVEMAHHINRFVADAAAWASSTLPDSNDPVWSEGPVPAAAGAHLVVLTDIKEVTESGSKVSGSGTVTAKVSMRALNSLGEEVWKKNLESSVPNRVEPKFMHAGAHPRSKAAWDASRKGIVSLKFWLDHLQGPREGGKPEVTSLPGPLIDVQITSIPVGADVLIDGVFKGNTPLKLSLPASEMEVRIQRAGFEPWVQKVVPSPEMRIQPALQASAPSSADGN